MNNLIELQGVALTHDFSRRHDNFDEILNTKRMSQASMCHDKYDESNRFLSQPTWIDPCFLSVDTSDLVGSSCDHSRRPCINRMIFICISALVDAIIFLSSVV